MKTPVWLLAAAGALVLASCATTYQPIGASGGFQDYPTAADQYEIYFRANGYTSPQTVYQFFLMRAAEIAMKRHYSSFYVLEAEDWSTRETYYTPGRMRTVEYVNVYRTYSRSRYGNIGFVDTTVSQGSVTYYSPGRAYHISLPGFRGRIQLVNSPLENQPAPFDAQSVYDDGLALKDQIDAYNRDVQIAGGVAVGVVVAGLLLFH